MTMWAQWMTQESDSRVEDSCGIPRGNRRPRESSFKTTAVGNWAFDCQKPPLCVIFGQTTPRKLLNCLFDCSGRLKHKCRFDCQKPILGDIDDSRECSVTMMQSSLARKWKWTWERKWTRPNLPSPSSPVSCLCSISSSSLLPTYRPHRPRYGFYILYQNISPLAMMMMMMIGLNFCAESNSRGLAEKPRPRQIHLPSTKGGDQHCSPGDQNWTKMFEKSRFWAKKRFLKMRFLS